MMNTEGQTIPEQRNEHTAIEMSSVDAKEYAEYQQFKRFQTFFNQSNNQTGYQSNYQFPADNHSSPSLKPTPHLSAQPAPFSLTPSLNGINPALRARSNSIMSQIEEAEFHGFLSQRFPQIANPAPLGLCAFALTTFVLSMYNAGAWVPTFGANGVVLGLAMWYGGVIQLLAGMWEFKTGNTFGALAFSSYGGFWLSLAAIRSENLGFLADYSGENADQIHNALGVWFFAWTIFTFLMLIASHRTSVALLSLFFFLTITFILLTIAEFTQNANTHQAGGAFGIITAAIAFYAAFAGVLDRKTQNSLFTLPVGDLRTMFPTSDELARRQGKMV